MLKGFDRSAKPQAAFMLGVSIVALTSAAFAAPASAQQAPASEASSPASSSAPQGGSAADAQAQAVGGSPENAPQAQSGPASTPLSNTQNEPDPTANTGNDVVVTGTRIVRDGYKAPTPTSVLGAQDIANKAPANIADYVNELPSLAANNTPRANVGFVSAGLVGINALNLRNLGPTRTLVLLDGQRVAASTLTGFTDVNTLPQQLVKRVDVVTGGASADWGSDAVAGVVNFVLDKEFTGLKGIAQGGVTTYGDDENFNVALTGGAGFADGRGHILLSAEYAYNDGIRSIGDRDWYNGAKLFINPAYNATTNNTVPQLIGVPNAGFATATPGGIITSGPLRGTYFGPNGAPTRFNYGPIVSGNFMQGGDSRYADFALSGDLDPKLTRQNYFGNASYDVSDAFQIFGQASYSRSTSRVATLNQFNFGNITIQRDNAFIPASIAAQVTAPFQLGTLNGDLGPIIAHTRRSSARGVIGAKGKFDALGSSWSWDAYAQRSVNRVYTDGLLTINARYAAAIDAVRNANGAIVCRSTLTNPTNGCVPYNIFGTGVNSQAALDYVRGLSFGKTKLTQNVQAATLRGEPFSTWAGPVSIATGIEHRTEQASGSNDALRSEALAASLPPPYFAGNYLATFGDYSVTEGFFETVVPLAKDLPLLKSLDLNGAVRLTDYSTSGRATTWKGGATYSPVEDITFRATRSRDIRAPNLAELFQAAQTSTTSITDPFLGGASATVSQITSGNLALQPEKADTLGLGVVVQPSFLPGFSASVDYYSIKIKRAITTVNAQTVLAQCFAGVTALCGQITRNAAGTVSTVAVIPVNAAQQKNRGLDIEASYRRQVFGGELSLRGLATRYLENFSSVDNIDTVGTNGMNGTLKNSLPKWRYVGNVTWDSDRLLLSVTGRGFSSGVYNTTYIECASSCPVSTPQNMTINDNHLPGAIYFDTNLTVKLPNKIEAFLAIDNIANKDPAQVAYGPTIGTAPLSVNPVLYDVIGRNFRAGLRFKL